MSYLIRISGLYFLLFLGYIPLASAQTLTETLVLADSAFYQNKQAEARNYYMRVAYFDTSRHYTTYCYQRLGDSYSLEKKYQQAVNLYDMAFHETQNDSLRAELSFARARCFLLNYQYQDALQDILSISDSISPAITRKRDTYLGLTYFALESFAESEQYLLKSMSNCTSQQTALKAIFVEQKNAKQKNPKVAQWLSTFMPGAGQFYAGDTKNALNSLAINSVFVYLFVATALNYNLVSAALSVFPWLQRYYLGGVNKAGMAAYERNYSARLARFAQIIKLGGECDMAHQ